MYREAPRLPLFSGDKGKGEVTYQMWRYDIRCLQKDKSCPEGPLLEAIRKAVRGMAADILLDLGTEVTVSKVLAEFDLLFGSVRSAEQLIEQFYVARQLRDETVAQWSCRLRNLASKAVDAGAVKSQEVKSMLRSKFWSGLVCPELKNALRHRFDAGEGYERLVRAARVVEEESPKVASDTKSKGKTQQVVQQQVQSTSTDTKLDKVLQQLQRLEGRMDKLEGQGPPPSQTSNTRKKGYCYECGEDSHFRNECPQLGRGPTKQQTHGGRGRGRGRGRGQKPRETSTEPANPALNYQ